MFDALGVNVPVSTWVHPEVKSTLSSVIMDAVFGAPVKPTWSNDDGLLTELTGHGVCVKSLLRNATLVIAGAAYRLGITASGAPSASVTTLARTVLPFRLV